MYRRRVSKKKRGNNSTKPKFQVKKLIISSKARNLLDEATAHILMISWILVHVHIFALLGSLLGSTCQKKNFGAFFFVTH